MSLAVVFLLAAFMRKPFWVNDLLAISIANHGGEIPGLTGKRSVSLLF